MGPESRHEMLPVLAERLITAAEQEHIKLRAFGGVGVRMHCSGMRNPLYGRRLYLKYDSDIGKDVYDLDLVADGSQILRVHAFMEASKLEMLGSPNCYRAGEHRSYLRSIDTSTALSVDVYFGALRFNHEIPRPYFAKGSLLTIPVTQLLLSKLAIVNTDEGGSISDLPLKDKIDITALIAEHEIDRTNDPEIIRANLLMKAWCSGCSGWGMARTCLANLESVSRYIKELGSLPEHVQIKIESGVRQLTALILRCPKSLCWKTRNVLGTDFMGVTLPYYDEVKPFAR